VYKFGHLDNFALFFHYISLSYLSLFVFWPTVAIGRAFGTLCRLSVTFCIVAKWYVLAINCLNEQIGNQGQKVDFWGSLPYFYFLFRFYGHQDGCFCHIFARTAKQSVIDGPNELSSSKPCVYCQIVWSELKPEVVLKCRKWLDMPYFAS